MPWGLVPWIPHPCLMRAPGAPEVVRLIPNEQGFLNDMLKPFGTTRIKRLTLWLCLPLFLLTVIGGSQGLLLCVDDDSHVMVERFDKAAACAEATASGTSSIPSSISSSISKKDPMSPQAGDHCGPCSDRPVLAGGPTSHHSQHFESRYMAAVADIFHEPSVFPVKTAGVFAFRQASAFDTTLASIRTTILLI